MLSCKMINLVSNSSLIRAMFEEGKKLTQIYGEDKVYDFSLGNPNVYPPYEIKETIIKLLEQKNLHAYMNNSGYEDVRNKVATSINKKFNTKFNENNIIMTVGAAGGLNIILKTLLNPQDEVIVFAPYFGEYNNYISNYDGKIIIIPATDTFTPDLSILENSINLNTKAIIINTPNNPTGVVYSESILKDLAEVLNRKQEQLNTSIYLISDEPYREIVYDNTYVPYVTNYYRNTFVVYSFSKSLSLPGERIGYVVTPSEVDEFNLITQSLNVANRILGFVNAPSLFQKIIGECIDLKVDISIYEKNRNLLYDSLIKFGFECIKPQGAFYLFPKSLIADDKEFVLKAKEFNLLIVPGSSFGCPGYVRIAYCVPYQKVENSLESFEKLSKLY